MDDFFIPFILLLCFVFGARVLNEKANKKLNDEKKVQLQDLFSQGRLTNYAFIIVIVSLYFIVLKYNLLNTGLAIILYIAILVVYLIYKTFSSYKKLKANNFPSNYINQYLASSVLRFVGMIVFFTLIMTAQ